MYFLCLIRSLNILTQSVNPTITSRSYYTACDCFVETGFLCVDTDLLNFSDNNGSFRVCFVFKKEQSGRFNFIWRESSAIFFKPVAHLCDRFKTHILKMNW